MEIKDNREAMKNREREVCRVCGSHSVHSKTYGNPTMDCIREFMRQRTAAESLIKLCPHCSRKYYGECACVLREALERIADPLGSLQKEAEAKGNRLNGPVAIQIANDAKWLSSIAEAALAEVKIGGEDGK